MRKKQGWLQKYKTKRQAVIDEWTSDGRGKKDGQVRETGDRKEKDKTEGKHKNAKVWNSDTRK